MALNLRTETAIPDPAAPQSPLSPAELAPHFPQLQIIECLGRGGMGVVYKARQKLLNRLVALKLLAPERVGDAKFARRFTCEAQALAALNHPGIVTIYDFGQAGGFYFLLMEFVDGVNLRQAMKAGRFSPAQALAVVPPVCEALQYAHEHGIVHRDIKPENLLLDKVGRVKIADFGIAKILGAEGALSWSEPQPQRDVESATEPAESNALREPTLASAAGTPQYMAPEQKEHRATDHRADIYSLGVVLYELLTGELPAEKMQPPSRKVQIDVRLDEIVLRALENAPELRYQTAGEFRTQVQTIVAASRVLSVPPVASPRTSSVAGSRAPYLLLVFLYAGLVAGLLASVPSLPDRVACHFGAEGRANGWMDRAHYLLFIAVMPLLLTAIFAGVARQVRTGPANLINLPRRDFWLAPERRALTAGLIRNRLAWLLCLFVMFFGGLHVLTMAANRTQPPQLPTSGLMLVVIGFLVSVIVWLSLVLMRLAETGEGRGSASRPNPPASTQPARLSRTALFGAGLVGMGLLSACMSFFVEQILTQRAGLGDAISTRATGTAAALALRGGAVLYLLVATWFGRVAVAQIQRAAGRLRGLGLAVFAGLFFPLLALDGAVVAVVIVTMISLDQSSGLVAPQPWTSYWGIILPSLPLLAFLDWLIIRRVWRAVDQPRRTAGTESPHSTIGRFRPPLLLLFGFIAALLGLGVFSWFTVIARVGTVASGAAGEEPTPIDQEVRAALAESASAPGISRALSLGPDGAISFAGQNMMSLEEMKAVLATNRLRSLAIRANRSVPLERVMASVQVLRAVGVVELSFEDGRIGDGRFRAANRTGRYALGGGRDLYLCRPQERAHWFTVMWPAVDGQPRRQWSIYPKVSPAARDRWAVVWEPGAVLVARESRTASFSRALGLPEEVKDSFALLGFKVGAGR